MRGNHHQVLLLSDDPTTIEKVRILLTEGRAGHYKVEIVPRVTVALDRIAGGGIDLVLLDVDLSEGTGFGVLLQMRERAANVPLVILAGTDDEQLAVELLRHGAQDFIAKRTLDSRTLTRAVTFALERDRTERQHQITLRMDNLPDCIILHEGKVELSKLTPAPEKTYKLDILIAPQGVQIAEVLGHDYAADLAADQMAAKAADTSVPGQVVERMLPDGRVSWNLATKPPVPDDGGRVVGRFCISQEDAAAPAVESGAGEMEERYSRLLNSVTDYVYTVKMQGGRVVSTEHRPGCRAITGYTPDEFKADPNLWNRIIHPDDREMVVAKVQQLVQWGVPRDIEHRLIQKSGRIAWVRNKQVPQYDSEGRLIAYDGLISDITERKHAEELLRAANNHLQEVVSDLVSSREELEATQLQLIQAEKLQSVGRLAAGVAHEVKNPMAILQMGIQYLADSPADDLETRGAVLAEMRSATDRANAVIENLQNFSSTRELENRTASVNAIVEDALAIVQLDMSKAGIAVVADLAPDLRTCNLEPHAIEQVLINILSNACQAMPSGGTLTLKTANRIVGPDEVQRTNGDRSGRHLRIGDFAAVIEIRDTGTGIPEDKLPHIFDLFYTTKETGKGQGLGLAVSKRIVELHGGRITLANAPGGGSVATIFLPSNPVGA
jgi:PAS domain S-box-containing protein